MDQPIACSLEAADAESQLDEWQVLLRPAIVSVDRPAAGEARMRLRSEFAELAPLMALARREVACCPFFRFSVEIDADGCVFAVTVPDAAAPILDAFTERVAP